MNHYADQIELHLDCKVRIYLIPKQPASSFLGEGGGGRGQALPREHRPLSKLRLDRIVQVAGPD